VVGTTLAKGLEITAKNVASSAINAVSVRGLVTGGKAFDSKAFAQGAFGKEAMAGVVAGMAGNATTQGLGKVNLVDGTNKGLNGYSFNNNSIAQFNNLAGNLAGGAVTYGMTGNVKFNVGKLFGVGVMEMNLGKDGFGMNFGMGGIDISPGTLISSMSGFRDTGKIAYAKMSNAFGDDRAISKLNAINDLGWTGALKNSENVELARALWSGKVKSEFADLPENKLGSFDDNRANTIILSNKLRGNDSATSAKLASVMSHEGYHQQGGNVEALAYMTGLNTYDQVNAIFNLTPDEAFWQGTANGILNRDNWIPTAESTKNCLITLTGQIVDNHRDGIYMEVPLNKKGQAIRQMIQDPAFKKVVNPANVGGMESYGMGEVFLGSTGDMALDWAYAMNLGSDSITQDDVDFAKAYLGKLGYADGKDGYALNGIGGEIINSVLTRGNFEIGISAALFPDLKVNNTGSLTTIQQAFADAIDEKVTGIKNSDSYSAAKKEVLQERAIQAMTYLMGGALLSAGGAGSNVLPSVITDLMVERSALSGVGATALELAINQQKVLNITQGASFVNGAIAAARSGYTALSPNIEVQFIQEARGGSIKPRGFVTTSNLEGLSATEINILTAADIPVGTKIELLKARLPLSSLQKPTSGNRLFRYNFDSLTKGKTLNGLPEYYAPYIPKQNVYQRIELGEVQQNIP